MFSYLNYFCSEVLIPALLLFPSLLLTSLFFSHREAGCSICWKGHIVHWEWGLNTSFDTSACPKMMMSPNFFFKMSVFIFYNEKSKYFSMIVSAKLIELYNMRLLLDVKQNE